MRFFGPNCPKRVSYFQSKTDKIDTITEFCIFELVFVSNFTLNKFHFEQTVLNFRTKFAQERDGWSKTGKLSIIIEFRLFKLVWYQISA